jgi:hypothetical protein
MSNLAGRKRATTVLINCDPISVSLTRHTATEGSYGGATYASATVAVQTFRLSHLPRPSVSMGANGQTISTSHVLYGQYNANIKAGDTFTSGGNTFEVMFVRVYPHKTECDLRLR